MALSLDESEKEELIRLRAENNELRQEVLECKSSNDTLVASVHHLSGELLKRRNPFSLMPSSSSSIVPFKRSRVMDSSNILRYSQKSASIISQKKESTEKEDIGLPNELMLHLFKYLSRSDLDRCSAVCRRWKKIIDVHHGSLARRRIRLFKIIETTPNVIMFSAATSTQNIKYHFNLNGENQSPEVIQRVAKMLSYSKVRRLVMCGFHLSEVMVHDLVTIFKKADVQFHRLEMIGVSLRNLSADTFQKFIGEHIIADQYFLDGICDGLDDQFGSRLLERTGIKKAEDVTIYDVSSINDEDVVLDIGDDVLLDFIFGKYTDAVDRATVYLDNPAVSSAFVYNALVRFAQEPDLKHAITHSEISHARDQVVHSNRSTTFEYDVDIQAEYSSYNPKTNSVLEAKISKQPDEEFVHITLTIATL